MIVTLPSRNQLIAWVNKLINANILRLQSLSDGIHFCQIFDKIYPKRINLNRLKRDAKSPLEKQKNFKLLLNAINDLGLLISINIIDLSEGKVTSILSLLIWIYKEYKNPSQKQGNEEQKDSRVSEPRMIKSYVGKLINRQVSCQKDDSNSSQLNKSRNNRRSLDAKLSKKTFLQADEQEQIQLKSQSKSKVKASTAKKQNSRMKSLTQNKQAFLETCKEEKQSMKRGKQLRKQQTFQQFLNQKLDCQNFRLQKTFIKVTEEILKNNPQLQQKIKRVIEHQNQNYPQNQNQQKNKTKSPFYGTSQQVQLDKGPPFVENLYLTNNSRLIVPQRQNSQMQSKIEKNEIEERKDILEKYSIKSGKQKSQSINLITEQVIKQISAQKQRAQNFQNQKKQLKQMQKQIQSSKFKLSRKICPHQKTINPEQNLTQMSAQQCKQNEITGRHRATHSQNLSFNLKSNSDDVWRPNQNMHQDSNLRFY